MKKHCATCALFFCCLSLYSQILVFGTIKNTLGEPLSGVNIFVPGTNIGELSADDGSYTVLAEVHAEIQYSIVGYETFIGKAPTDGKLDVVLQEGVLLAEVVVTAMGLRKEKDALPYTYEQLDAHPLTIAREINTGDALTGLIPGLNATNIASGPGGSTRIVIRGYNSLSRDNQPLFIVDGIPIDNRTLGSASLWGGSDWGDGLSSLNPDDIDKIIVLKGFAAAALYGSRASNGVILITSKRGASRKGIGVELSSSFTMEQPLVSYGFQQEYGQGFNPVKPVSQNEAFVSNWFNWGPKLDGGPAIQFDGVVRPYAAHPDNFRRFYKNGHSYNTAIALTGGNESVNWRFGFSSLDNNFIIPNTAFDRKTFTLATTGKLSKNFTTEITARYVLEDAANRPRMSDSPGNANYAVAVLPTNVPLEALKGETGNGDSGGAELGMSANPWITNPYWATSHFRTSDQKNRLIGTISLRYETEWFYLHGRIGTDYSNSRRTDVTPAGTAYNPDGAINEQTFKSTETNADFMAGSRHSFLKKFGYDIFAGANRMESTFENIGLGGNKFNIAGLETVQNTTNQNNWYSLLRRRVNSVFASAALHWQHGLYLTFTGRNDWFSTLPADKNNLFYPSAGASFVFSELIKMPAFLTHGKVYASWAKVSGDVDPYSLDLTYQLNGQSFQGQALGIISNTTVPDRALAPSISKEVETGFEIRLVKNRLGVNLAFYQRQTKNDIIVSTISNASGFESAFVKEGGIKNRGIEGLVTATVVRLKNWDWSFSVNAAKNQNKVTNLGKNVSSIQIDASRTFNAFLHHDTGEPASVIKGFTYVRDDEGNVIYGADGLPLRGNYAVLGNGVPDFTGGINNEFRWRNFRLSFLIDFKTGGEIYSATNAYAYHFGLHKKTLEGREIGLTGNGVTTSGEPNTVHIDHQNLRTYYSYLFSNITEEFVYDADFIKLRQVILTVNLPEKWLSKMPVKGFSVSLAGRNLALLYSKVPNVDPESTYNNSNAQGLEMFGVPQTRNFGIQLRAQF
jgi:TonB-linked SusC/RagA family outer membrane protein